MSDIKYFKLGNGLIKVSGEGPTCAAWFVNWEKEWEISQELVALFQIGDLTSDPEPISEVEAAVLFEKLTGKAMT